MGDAINGFHRREDLYTADIVGKSPRATHSVLKVVSGVVGGAALVGSLLFAGYKMGQNDSAQKEDGVVLAKTIYETAPQGPPPNPCEDENMHNASGDKTPTLVSEPNPNNVTNLVEKTAGEWIFPNGLDKGKYNLSDINQAVVAFAEAVKNKDFDFYLSLHSEAGRKRINRYFHDPKERWNIASNVNRFKKRDAFYEKITDQDIKDWLLGNGDLEYFRINKVEEDGETIKAYVEADSKTGPPERVILYYKIEDNEYKLNKIMSQ